MQKRKYYPDNSHKVQYFMKKNKETIKTITKKELESKVCNFPKINIPNAFQSFKKTRFSENLISITNI